MRSIRLFIICLDTRAPSASIYQKELHQIMYNILRSEILKCRVCAHTERVNEFDDRHGSRRIQAAQAMLNHTRADHGKNQWASRCPRP
jgi:hypothetical protein